MDNLTRSQIMTAALGNTTGGTPFATGVDAFVYPQFIGYALRVPTTQDIYNPGTRWQDNSVNPAVQYYTIGSGIWYQLPSISFGVSSVSGTTNQVTAAPTVGAVILSIPATFVAPGSITATTSITATLGNITATNGNLVLGTAGNKIISTSVGTTASAGANSFGSATLVLGTVTIATTAVTASSLIKLSRQSIGATGANPLGSLVAGTITPGTSFVINAASLAVATSVATTDVSVVNWEIVN